MPPFRPSSIRLAQTASSATRVAAREALANRATSAPFPVVPTCPSPSCECLPMPDGLDIDRSTNINGTMAPYSRHILVFTGQNDWKSRIEDEHSTGSWGPYLAHLKKAFGRNGKHHDPYKNVLVSACSWFGPDAADNACSAVVFPSSQLKRYRPSVIDERDGKHLDGFVDLIHEDEHVPGSSTIQSNEIKYPTVLICSHNGRDSRCGILGPILHREFSRVLRQQQYNLPSGDDSDSHSFAVDKVNIGMLSHIGGHKWAGNVIVYLPKTWKLNDSPEKGNMVQSPLAGSGIWYGRVEPKHVEGIVQETILRGRVVQELFRGGLGEDGQILRIP